MVFLFQKEGSQELTIICPNEKMDGVNCHKDLTHTQLF